MAFHTVPKGRRSADFSKGRHPVNGNRLRHLFEQYRLGFWGFALCALPLLAAAAPLLWHQSDTPEYRGYSRGYALGLVLIAGISLSVSSWLGWRCQKKGSLQPAFKFFVPFCSLMVMALLAEIFLRSIAPDSFSEYRRGGHRKALLSGFEAERRFSWREPYPMGGSFEYHTDEFGFRVNRHAPDWYEQRRHQTVNSQHGMPLGPLVFTLGGSSVFGRLLNDDETWPHCLQGDLAKAGHAATVVNAGNTGHNSVQAVQRLYFRVLPHMPDVVLYYLAFNDTSRRPLALDAIPLDEAVAFSDSLPCYLRAKNARKNVYWRTMLYYHLHYVLNERFKPFLRSMLGRERYEELRSVFEYGSSQSGRLGGLEEGNDNTPAHEDADAIVVARNGRRYLRNLRTMVDMCKRNGTRLVPVTFVCDTERIDPYVHMSIKHYNQLMRQVAREEGLALVDLEWAFSTLGDLERYFAADHYHPSRLGARQMAAVLAEAFPEWGVPKTASKGKEPGAEVDLRQSTALSQAPLDGRHLVGFPADGRF